MYRSFTAHDVRIRAIRILIPKSKFSASLHRVAENFTLLHRFARILHVIQQNKLSYYCFISFYFILLHVCERLDSVVYSRCRRGRRWHRHSGVSHATNEWLRAKTIRPRNTNRKSTAVRKRTRLREETLSRFRLEYDLFCLSGD